MKIEVKPEVVKILLERAYKRMTSRASEIKTGLLESAVMRSADFSNWWDEFCPKPRGILPETVEAELENPGSTDLTVLTSEEGNVITVFKNGTEDSSNDEIARRIEAQILRQARLIEHQTQLFKGCKYYIESEVDETGLLSETVRIIPPSKQNRQKEMADLNTQQIIERRARYVREQALSLDGKFQGWKTQTQQKKQQKKSKSVDIAAWKAAQKKN